MRRIDRWLGIPACFVLTRFRRCGDLWRRLCKRNPNPGGVERILFVKPAEQGATVLAYSAIRKAVDLVGRRNVFFLVFEENRFVLDAMDVVGSENVLTISTAAFWRLLWSTLVALRRLRSLRADAAVDLEFFARSSAVLTYLSGARRRVGLHEFGDPAPYRGDLMTHRIRYDPDLHTSQAFAMMVDALCVSPDELPGAVEGLPPGEEREEELAVFSPRPEEVGEVESIVRREAQTDDYSPLVLLNANASDLLPVRRWPADRYVELARRLLERSPKVRVAFTGAPDEAAVAAELAAGVGSDRCFSMAGKTTLRQLLVLYHLAEVLVTNDSGPAHFATLTPIHAVTLFGPETPARFAPRGPRAHVLWKNIPCSPCVNAYNGRLSTCRDNRCMKEISVEEVLDRVCEILGI